MTTSPDIARNILKKIEDGEPLRLFIGRFPHMSEIVLTPNVSTLLRHGIAAEIALLILGDDLEADEQAAGGAQ